MGYEVRQGSTAARDDLIFYMRDSANHLVGKAGLAPTVVIRKPGGNWITPTGAVSELQGAGAGRGYYRVAANAADNDTLGVMALQATSAGADECNDEFQVVVHDPCDVGAKQTGDAYARVGAPAGASLSADVAAVKTDTNATRAAVESGTFGLSVLDAEIDAVKVDTAAVRTAVESASSGLARLDTEIDAIQADTTAIKLVTDVLAPLRTGTAQTGAAGSVTLDAGASAVNDYYKGSLLVITGGTGAGQVRAISGYVGSTKVASVSPNWATAPGGTSTFSILPDAGQVALITALFATVLDGTGGNTKTFQSALQDILAKASGNMVQTGNSYAYYDRDGVLKFTLTVAAGSVTRS